MAPRPQNQKRRPESARRANRIIQTRTLLLLGVFGVLTFVLLFTQLYHWQITEHDELQSVAVRQQTLRTTVEASRGTIYDRNGTILAMSASAEDEEFSIVTDPPCKAQRGPERGFLRIR